MIFDAVLVAVGISAIVYGFVWWNTGRKPLAWAAIAIVIANAVASRTGWLGDIARDIRRHDTPILSWRLVPDKTRGPEDELAVAIYLALLLTLIVVTIYRVIEQKNSVWTAASATGALILYSWFHTGLI